MEQIREPRNNRPTYMWTIVNVKERTSKDEEGEKKGKWLKREIFVSVYI